MSALFASVGWNTLAALGLAVAVLLAGRIWKRPELIHVLWIVVLVKLVTPGFVTIDAIPSPAAAPAAMSAPIAPPDTDVAAPAVTPAAARSVDWTSIAFGVWLAGSVLFLAVVAARVRRFVRALRIAVPADPDLIESVEQLARRIDVRRPRIRVVDAALSPMVWGGFEGATLILPLKLMRELDGVERDTLLAHELAHLKRGDCWVRWIELTVTAVLWWNPVVWWVRRNLRRAEEQACDRWVLELLPRAGRAYADGIVKTVEFIAGHRRTPALATGATGARQIEERLTMILDPARPARLRRPLLPALALALLVLPVIPGFAERGDSKSDDTSKAELFELEQQALELEQRLHEVQLRREEVERRLELSRFKRDSAEMRRQVDELRAQGMHGAAAELEADVERTERRVLEEQQRNRARLDQERARHEAELRWREAMIQRERAADQDDTEAVEAYEKAMKAREREMYDREIAMREAEIAYEKAREIEHARELEATLAEQQRRLESEAQQLGKARQEILMKMERIGGAIDKRHASGADTAGIEDMKRELEELSRDLARIELELGRVKDTAR